jgi:hypothetical protein
MKVHRRLGLAVVPDVNASTQTSVAAVAQFVKRARPERPSVARARRAEVQDGAAAGP